MLFLLGFLGMGKNVDVQKTRPDGSFRQIVNYTWSEKKDSSSPSGYTEEYRFILSDAVRHDTCLAFYTMHQYVQVYLDETNVYTSKSSDEFSVIKTSGGIWVMIPLYPGDVGKEVRIVITPVYENARNRDMKFMVGSELSIIKASLKHGFPLFIVSALTMLAGAVFIGVGVYNRLINKKKGELFSFGVFAFLLGLWRFTDTEFPLLALPDRAVFPLYLSVAALMFGMIPLVISQKKNLQENSVYIYCTIVAVTCIVQVVLQYMGILDLCESLFVTWCLVFFGIILIWISQVRQVREEVTKTRQIYRKIIWGLLLAGILADAITYFVTRDSARMIFFMLAFLIYIVIHLVMFGIEYQNQQIMLAEKEQQIMNTRISVMMSQIRSHFVFNVLNAISGMCKYDPEKADQTVVCFARYLRTNIDIMQEDRPITFRQALSQLEDYIALEKIRYGDRLHFVKDIRAEDFMLPSLILQPIVENALEHGLKQKPEGGTIILRTWEADDEIRILVEDDGIGFDTEVPQDKRSVGLKNVSFRLQHMMHGRLTINSSPEKGTIVTISISRKEAEECM